jgi:hypothetical protein
VCSADTLLFLLPLLQQQRVSFIWTTPESKLIHRGLKGYRKLEETGDGSTTLTTLAPTSAPTSQAPTRGPTNAPTSAPSIPNVAVAIGGAFGTGWASAGVSSAGGTGKSFSNSNSRGFSSSFARKPSGAEVMTDSTGRGTAQTDASVNVVDETFTAGYSNVQNYGYGASISVNGDHSNYNLGAVVETLTAEPSKEMPFFGLFSGGFGAIIAILTSDPDASTSDPDVTTSDTSISGEEASVAGTSDKEKVKKKAAGVMVENIEDESAPVASPFQSRYQSEGGSYGSYGFYGSYRYSP